jgi:hypothetical protein
MNSVVIKPEVLVDKIKQIQQSKGFTDQQMADNLGCSRLTYFKTRTALPTSRWRTILGVVG